MKAFFVNGDTIRHFTDSSAQRNHQPWFMPDDLASKWCAIIYPSIRVNRLGYNISQKFASRYYEEVAPTVIFAPDSHATATCSMPEIYFLRDAAYCFGEPVAVGVSMQEHNICFEGTSISFSVESLGADEIISNISKYSTLKMGDLVIFANQEPIIAPLDFEKKLAVSVDGKSSIELKVK